MYKHAVLQSLTKLAKKEPVPVFPQLSPVCQISAKNQGIDPCLLQWDPGAATDKLMQRFLAGKIKRYNPEEDEQWQQMLGKSAAALGDSMLDLAAFQRDLQNNKRAKEIQDRMPMTSTGLWARQHNSIQGDIHSPYQAAEYYNKLTHMTHQEDLMPGAGSRSQSLNTRQNITKPNPTYGTGRGTPYRAW